MARCRSDLLLVRPDPRPGAPGERFVLVDAAAADPDAPVASCVVSPLGAGWARIGGFAVRSGHAGCGHGRRLLSDVADALRAAGMRRLVGHDQDGRAVDVEL